MSKNVETILCIQKNKEHVNHMQTGWVKKKNCNKRTIESRAAIIVSIYWMRVVTLIKRHVLFATKFLI